MHRLPDGAYPRIHRIGLDSFRRNRNGRRRQSARSRRRQTLALPQEHRKSRGNAHHRLAGNREKSGSQPRRVAHRACLSRCVVLAHRLSQRPHRTRRFALGKPFLHGRHRDTQHQPLCHTRCFGRPRQHCQRRPDTRDYLLHRRFPRQPLGSPQFGARLPTERRQSRQADIQGHTGCLGSLAQRCRTPKQTHHLPLLGTAVVPANAVQGAGTAFPAQLHRRTVQGEDPLLRPRRTDLARLGGHRQDETEYRRERRGCRIPAELPADHQSGDLHAGCHLQALQRPARSDPDPEPQLPEQPQPEVSQQRRLIGRQPDAASALHRAENNPPLREPDQPEPVDLESRSRTEPHHLQQRLAPTVLHRRHTAVDIRHLAAHLQLRCLRHRQLYHTRQAFLPLGRRTHGRQQLQ